MFLRFLFFCLSGLCFYKGIEYLGGIPFLGIFTYSDDLYFFDNHWLLWAIHRVCFHRSNFTDHILPLNHLSEDSMAEVEPIGSFLSDEELTTIGSRAGVSHCQLSLFSKGKGIDKLVGKLIAWVSCPCSCTISRLEHEVLNHAVRLGVVIIMFPFERIRYISIGTFGQGNKVGHCSWSCLVV